MKIRKAVAGDAKSIAQVHVDSWRTTYREIVPEDYLKQLSYEKREEMWTGILPNGGVYVAENQEGRIVGFSSGGKDRSGEYKGFEGELYAIYILEEYQGKGIGRLLVKPIVQDLLKEKINSMTVFVFEDNEAKYFYESLGAKPIDRLETEFAGKKLFELVYGWEDIRSIVID